MIVRDWNIWHTYSTYTLHPFTDLDKVAELLVQSGLVVAAYSTSGVVWWQEDGAAMQGHVTIDRIGVESHANFELPLINDPYALEVLTQAVRMRFYELYFMSDVALERQPYVRAYLGQCELSFKSQTVLLYPQVKIYGNGVILVELRSLANRQPYPITSFVNEQVNLFCHYTSEMLNPPELVLLYARADWLSSGRIVERYRNWRAVKWIDEQLLSHVQTDTSGDFHFHMVSANPTEFEQREEFNTYFLFDCIRSAISFVLNQDREGWDYILRGPKAPAYPFGASWAGRPNVYILGFDRQPQTTSDFGRGITKDLAHIMARWDSPEHKVPEKYLGPNLRSSDDFAVYINDALSLWVFSRKGLEADKEYANPNADHLVLPHQVKMELVDFFEASHRRLLELSWGQVRSVSSALRLRKELVALEEGMRRWSLFGELNEMFQVACGHRGIAEMKARLDENITLKVQQLAEQRERAVTTFGWLLALVLGLAGARDLGGGLVGPLLQLAGVFPPTQGSQSELVTTVLAGVFIILLVLVTWVITVGRSNRN